MTEAVDTPEQKEHRDSMAKQTWYDVDSDLNDVLDGVFGREDDDPDAFIMLTVVAQGAVISGTAVPRVVYIEKLASALDAAGAGERIRSLYEAGRKVAQELEATGAEFPSQRSSINFVDARVWSGTGVFETKSLNVALRHVSAWSLGAFHSPEKAD
jgi:hypothetical protein